MLSANIYSQKHTECNKSNFKKIKTNLLKMFFREKRKMYLPDIYLLPTYITIYVFEC